MSLKYLKLKIDDEELDIDTNSDLPITFDYQLEDTQDFQRKKSSESIGMKLPATLNNQRILNTFQNTAVEDNTPNKIYKKLRKIVAESNGNEIFIGTAIPKRTVKRGAVPTGFELNCFGNNADWIINLKDTTLFDLVKNITLIFNKNTIINSWNYDGTDENLPYVFAPVKYAGWLDPDDLYVDPNNPVNNRSGSDNNYSIKTMKPSLSAYWIIYWAFKSLGFKIQSDFLDSDYFRRLTLPWVYGAFLSSEGTKYEIHRFLAKSYDERTFYEDSWCNLIVYDNTDSGCYDNNNTISVGDYTGNDELPNVILPGGLGGNAGVSGVTITIPAGIGGAGHGGGEEMRWTYNPPHYGPLEVHLLLSLEYSYRIDTASSCDLDVYWYLNGNEVQHDHIFDHTAPTFGNTSGQDIADLRLSQIVNPGDVVICKVHTGVDISKTADTARVTLKVLEFSMEYIKIPIGGTISFDSYLSFQKSKFLDYFAGIIDLFNLSIQTDPVNKIVLIEPTHDYSLTDNLAIKKEGYFTKNILDFTQIEDISQDSIVELYDDNAREFVFRFKDDSNDGTLKIIQDRYQITLAAGKYVFDERFKAEKTEFQNRFFSPTMHYLVDDFATITGKSPQMICLVPENISNTSSSEAQNTFSPKIAFYKGLTTGVGGWNFKDENGNITTYQQLPFMFSVNYNAGGENDPILSYTDEKIGINGNYVVGKGLIKRFFWQRMAIMNNGQWLNTQFVFNNKDITNWFHRERINLNGELWELITIKGYNCLTEKSTKCVLRKWVPISKEQLDNTYPSQTSILTNAVVVITPPPQSDPNTIDKIYDTQYNRLMCLYNDIPKPQ